MPGCLAALPGHGGAAGRLLHARRACSTARAAYEDGRLQPAPRLDSLDAGRALPLHARRRAGCERAAPGILAGADWIINETARTANRHELERGLLPAGSLEDIGDWWTWLSTSCYTWRGLDSAAWALEQIKHPEATRVRKEADAYHANLLANFRKAAERSPVVRLRDGTAVPHIPSMVHRRGRNFGWICETLEGSLHLLITRRARPALAGGRLDSQGLRGQPLPLEPIRLHCWMISTSTGSAAAACPCRPACCSTSSPTSTATT